MGCANGDVAPFVGHNAFLRWSALQEAAIVDPSVPLDEKSGLQEAEAGRKIWSESNVSEDFDMALRLQMKGYVVRWANYSEGGFKEGVSLTVDDELNRWRKYAYGETSLVTGELMMNIPPTDHRLQRTDLQPVE
jgi:cellulose synthase/poly-beta-1,6-N-acetylglucosamine synthase-like glycosyltransferase